VIVVIFSITLIFLIDHFKNIVKPEPKPTPPKPDPDPEE